VAVEQVLTGPVVTRTGERSVRIEAVLDDRWQIVYAQGGAVMAATLEGALAAVRREDLALVSASTTFHRPVACGPVLLEAMILRSSRSSAQVTVELRSPGSDAGPAATTTAVLAAAQPGWSDLVGAPIPVDLLGRPEPDHRRLTAPGADGDPFRFFEETEWRVVPEDTVPDLECRGWFRFTSPSGSAGEPWSAPVFAIPADALGCSVVPRVRLDDSPVFALSMQMSVHILGPAAGDWLALQSQCLHVGAGVATGLTLLWDRFGTPVAASTQTALLRAMPPGH